MHYERVFIFNTLSSIKLIHKKQKLLLNFQIFRYIFQKYLHLNGHLSKHTKIGACSNKNLAFTHSICTDVMAL